MENATRYATVGMQMLAREHRLAYDRSREGWELKPSMEAHLYMSSTSALPRWSVILKLKASDESRESLTRRRIQLEDSHSRISLE